MHAARNADLWVEHVQGYRAVRRYHTTMPLHLLSLKPGLTWLAALGCAFLQAFAIVFHLSRGEAANTPFNFVLVVLALFVFWGRRSRVPIQPRA